MITYACPHCTEPLEAPEEMVSQDMRCPVCQGRTIVPTRVAAAQRSSRRSHHGVSIPILISAICNIVVGLMWASLCFTIPISILLWILCIFEFMLYARADRIAPHELASQARTIGIIEIVAGLANVASLVCGIIVLINASKLTEPRRY